ncbi:MAG: histidine phosphatase family protein, partial [Actinobacteria bacterium]|nr:histidine phosphatase family protein [Actinomycetota bacterium]NIS35078.1 histidine phosphatase family protein [Actinomycetota bacterium]NIT95861.1 histidine phosphatase family protein [Actinomycetota bacterium]NIU21552.1 histidine phosphatase family protein [Actinomycetota bacterium]NIU69806.1 histidine phosphatase family protein [Actinomycetota bacterium]
MEIVLVRHAEPAWVSDGRTVADPGLTPLGTAQARAAAIRLGGLDG